MKARHRKTIEKKTTDTINTLQILQRMSSRGFNSKCATCGADDRGCELNTALYSFFFTSCIQVMMIVYQFERQLAVYGKHRALNKMC